MHEIHVLPDYVMSFVKFCSIFDRHLERVACNADETFFPS
jgi:hypothetical protein